MPPKKTAKRPRVESDDLLPRQLSTRRSSGSRGRLSSTQEREEAPVFVDSEALKPLRATIGAVGHEGQEVELVPMSIESQGKTILGWHGTFRNIAVRFSKNDTMFATALVSAILPVEE